MHELPAFDMTAIDRSPLKGRMVFLVGVMRSGTNWLQRMLTVRREVYGLPTETLLFRSVREFESHLQHANVGSLTVGRPYIGESDFYAQMRHFCDSVFLGYAPNPTLPERVLERSPDHVNHVDMISAIYPDSYVVHIIRDGRDVARSLLNMDFGPSTLFDAASEWKASILGAREHSARLENYIEVRYEDLLKAPEIEMPKLFGRLGLSLPEVDIQAVLREGSRPFNVDRNFPTVASGKWSESFSAADTALFDDVAGDLLSELGYARSESAPSRPGPTTKPEPAPARRTWPWRRARSSPPTARDPMKLGLESQSGVADALLGALIKGNKARLRVLLADDCRVDLVLGDQEWRERGPAAIERLSALTEDDPALKGRQLQMRMHPSAAQWVLIGTFETSAGLEHRLIVLQFDGSRVAALTYYRLGAAPGF
jgi:hypothetical protein